MGETPNFILHFLTLKMLHFSDRNSTTFSKLSKIKPFQPCRKRQISKLNSYSNIFSMSVQPLTSLVVVENKNNCPAGYECLGLTDTGQDADLWKDGWFSTVKRYLCYSRDPRHSEYNTLIVSIQMVSGSESVPQNFEVISTTSDSQKPALKNNMRIIYRRLPLVQTSAVVSDIAIYDQKSVLPSRWQCIAVINNMQLVVKQVSKKELENNNNSNKNENNGDNLLQQSKFRSAKMRSQ